MPSRQQKERTIEAYLNKYNTYKIGLKNCQRQLDYISPSLVGGYSSDGLQSVFYISNNTERVAIDRLTSKKALDLVEEIEQYKLIIESIDNALAELDEQQKKFVELRYFKGLKIYEVKELMFVQDEKTLFRLRRKILEKFLISLNNLINLR
jgi:DNA-directed RNA polymerase specialized sigma subunit